MAGSRMLLTGTECGGNGGREFRRARAPFDYPQALIERSIFYSSIFYPLKGYSLAVAMPYNASERISDNFS